MGLLDRLSTKQENAITSEETSQFDGIDLNSVRFAATGQSNAGITPSRKYNLSELDGCGSDCSIECCQEWTVYSLMDKLAKAPAIRSAALMSNTLLWLGEAEFVPLDENVNMNSKSVKKKVKKNQMLGKSWLSNKNRVGVSNQNILMEGTLQAQILGYSLMARYDRGANSFMQVVPYDKFDIIMREQDEMSRGLQEIMFYWVNHDRPAKEQTIEDVLKSLPANENIVSDEELEYLFEDSASQYRFHPDEVLHLKRNDMTVLGYSELLFNQWELQLVMDALKDNITSVNHGYPRMFGMTPLQTEGKTIDPNALGITPEQYQANPKVVAQKIKMKYEEIVNTWKKLKNEGKGNLAIINSNLIERVEKVEREFKSVEYLEHIRKTGVSLAANYFGIQPALLGANETTYASNIAPAIETTINFGLEPTRRRYEEQINTQLVQEELNKTIFKDMPMKLKLKKLDVSDPKTVSEIAKNWASFVEISTDKTLTPYEGAELLKDKLGLETNTGEDSEGLRKEYWTKNNSQIVDSLDIEDDLSPIEDDVFGPQQDQEEIDESQE